MLRPFGNVERMNRRLTKQIYMASANGQVDKGRPRKIYHDQIEDVLKDGRMCVDEETDVNQDRSKW